MANEVEGLVERALAFNLDQSDDYELVPLLAATITALKAEVERLEQERDEAREALRENAMQQLSDQGYAEAKEQAAGIAAGFVKPPLRRRKRGDDGRFRESTVLYSASDGDKIATAIRAMERK